MHTYIYIFLYAYQSINQSINQGVNFRNEPRCRREGHTERKQIGL